MIFPPALLAAIALALGFAPAATAKVPQPPTGVRVVTDPAQVRAATSHIDGTAFAYADVTTGTIYTSARLDRFELAHEVGHVVDWQLLTDQDRAVFAEITHAPAGGWFDWAYEGDGAEYFADYYAAAATNFDPRPHRVKGGGLQGGSVGSYATITWPRLQAFKRYLNQLSAR